MRQIRKRRNRYSARRVGTARRGFAQIRIRMDFLTSGKPPCSFPPPALSARNNIVPSTPVAAPGRVDLNAREEPLPIPPAPEKHALRREATAAASSLPSTRRYSAAAIRARKTRRDHRVLEYAASGSQGDGHEIRFSVRPDKNVARTVARPPPPPSLFLSSSRRFITFFYLH